MLLSPELTPIDADLSPSALQDRHAPAEGLGTIVFVPPSNVALGV
ncbi:MAG TPA: hypothetical protein VEF89_19935 [Solirubrobacteraceae bacterium]|nr:hypothetical protein [Solirubrobacteraceae bacterium]